jgi:hypothetical protein
MIMIMKKKMTKMRINQNADDNGVENDEKTMTMIKKKLQRRRQWHGY